MLASQKGDLEMAKILIVGGANYNMKNRKNQMALDMANNNEMKMEMKMLIVIEIRWMRRKDCVMFYSTLKKIAVASSSVLSTTISLPLRASSRDPNMLTTYSAAEEVFLITEIARYICMFL